MIPSTWIVLALLAGLAEEPAPPVAGDAAAVEAPPTWRFRRADKPVKVVVLAGSIGAWPKQPYAEQLETLCANVEVHNLSQVGQGAWALKKRFRTHVLENRRIELRNDALEHWLVYGGGLNSVGTPKSTNKHMRDLFVLAHGKGVKVVALSLTPWGDASDRRWRGFEGLEYRRVTQQVVDYTMGRLSPADAFGEYGRKRPGGVEAPWDPAEVPDVAVDLYDSELRDRDAAPLDFEVAKAQLAKDKRWKAARAGLDEQARALQLDIDAATVAELPRWFLRGDLRSFDHIHPNADGHRIMAETMCPRLPQSWGCTCPGAPESPPLDAAVRPEPSEPGTPPEPTEP